MSVRGYRSSKKDPIVVGMLRTMARTVARLACSSQSKPIGRPSTTVLATWHIRSEKAAVRRRECAFIGCKWMCTRVKFADVNMCSQDNMKINGSS